MTSFDCFSQTDFRPGYVVLSNGDTLQGVLDYRSNKRNAQACLFKDNANQQETTYGPSDLKGFGYLNDKKFESRLIPLSSLDTILGYAEVVLQGKASLYQYIEEFYISKDAGEWYKLEVREVERRRDGQTFVTRENRYRNILAAWMPDCAAVKGKINSVALNRGALVRLLETYNSCVGTTSETYAAKKDAFKIEAGVVLGFVRSNVNYRVDIPNYSFFIEPDYTSISPIFGGDFEISSPKISEYVALHVGLLFTKLSYSASPTINFRSFTQFNEISFSFTEFKIPLALRAVIPVKSKSLYFEIGNSFNFLASQEAIRIERRRYSDGRASDNTSGLFEPKGSQNGLFVGFGTKIPLDKKYILTLNFKFENSSFIFDNTYGQFGPDATINDIRNSEISFLVGLSF